MDKKLTIALAGNPNSGKTTVFNAITKSRQRVGNYPGVTVEKVEGNLKYKGYDINVIDLPGTYSLTAYSLDEIVARNFILDEKPDVVVDIIDATNIERNLYLAVQLMELNIPLVLAFNMYDLAKRRGIDVNKKRLGELLGAPIVFTVGTKNKGINELLDEAILIAEDKEKLSRTEITYGNEVHEELEKIETLLIKDQDLINKYPARWLALKLLEEDSNVYKIVKESTNAKEILDQNKTSIHHLNNIYDDVPSSIIADGRYGYISGACSEAVKRNYEVRHTISDKIDNILINRLLGLPIFLFFMWIVFKFTFTASEPFMELIEKAQNLLGKFIGGLFTKGSIVQSLIVDGVIGGVGGVLVFVPIIFLMFFALAILEGTGYMARAAFLMDKFMHKIGLHGRSFIPMLLGFGCNASAIMATRTIEDKNDRLVTMLITPFMSCSARLPVYALFIGAFFSKEVSGNILFSLYILGIVVACIMAKILRKYMLKGDTAPFVMELPPYRIPTLKGTIIHMWERGVIYLRKAGTVILAGSIIIWFLSNFPWNPNYSKDYNRLINQTPNKEVRIELQNEMAKEKLEKSFAGSIGKTIAPVFRPLGFNDWKVSVGLVGGFVAKEIVVSTLGTINAVGKTDENSESLRQAIQMEKHPDGRKIYDPLVAYSLMVFILLYVPCLAVFGVIRRETNSWRWPIFSVCYSTTVAWIAAFIIYNGGKLLGFG